MEGKTVIFGLLILSLVLAQVQVEAKKKSCCPSTLKRNIYNACRLKFSQETCAKTSGCKLEDKTCPEGWQKAILENSGDAINEYCKLGCASSVCYAITTLETSDAGEEVVNEAVEQCTNACSEFCTKGSTSAIEIA
ncbi:Thionin-2.2 [Thalictrum thalictroides]|uniref:Thionin-2.2 n=1 Tax=Thalictrum thalictroides TaxID=46969 RepID=A0A7J6WEN6_THATH|nr:Thionin-2.2 [Thalictrum thalictroides]